VFRSTHRLMLFDYLRIPFTVEPAASGVAPAPGVADRIVWARLTPARPGRPSLFWPRAAPLPRDQASTPAIRRFRLGDDVLHARLVPDEALAGALTAAGWTRTEPLTDATGDRLGSLWRGADGGLLLPFDPDEVVTVFWSEAFVDAGSEGAGGRARRLAMAAYYGVRPVLPRRLQIAARRLYSRVQARRDFPRWPVEESLHDLFDRVLGWAAELAGAPVPHLAWWPHGHRWALVLTHDVETQDGVRLIPLLRSVEERTGNRSSWNLVPGRYRVDDALVRELQGAGFEVGVHGLHHDGRDLEPGEFERRLPQMRGWAERWGAVGFRSPATHRDWDTMASLPFEYDSSSPDTDPYEPQPGGCGSLLPFPNRGIVELPITLPQDHTLFVILQARDAGVWIDKTDRIRARGGMALIITHPDYTVRAPIARAYEELLNHLADDRDVWRALPAEVAAWWRRRAASSLGWDGATWTVSGPAAGEATVAWSASPAEAFAQAGELPAAAGD